MRSRWVHNATVLTLALTMTLVMAVAAACGGGGGSDDNAAPQTTKPAKPDKAAFCRLWAGFEAGTSYHPDMAAYRQFWGTNDKVAKQLVGVAPESIRDDVAALADGVAAMKVAAGRATSPKTWSPAETKLYLKQVRLPEVQVSNYADQDCPPPR